MAKHHKRLIVGLTAGIAVCAAVIGSSVLVSRISSADPEATDNVRIVDNRKLPEQWVINAAYGRGALSNLRAALAEIENGNANEARKGVSVAQSLLAKIKPESPHTKVDTAVEAGSLDEPRPVADLILVHSEVRVLDDVAPTSSVRAKLDNIRSEIAMNDHEAIITALDSLNTPLAYTRIDLPLSETITLVNESLQALESKDTGQARSMLMEIGNGLRIDTVRVGIEALPSNPQSADDAS